ncbi:MAG: MaoC family dehydratase [Pseudomonadota bacterium]
MTVALPEPGPHRFLPLPEMRALINREAGVSDWIEISQGRINAFADLAGDHQFIHVDQERAAETPFGGTIAHGFYTLSLLTFLGQGPRPRIEGTVRSLNYGFDRVRFAAPVPSGGAVRARFTLAEMDESRAGEVTLHWDVTVEIRGQEIADGGRPALSARWITRAYLGTAG